MRRRLPSGRALQLLAALAALLTIAVLAAPAQAASTTGAAQLREREGASALLDVLAGEYAAADPTHDAAAAARARGIAGALLVQVESWVGSSPGTGVAEARVALLALDKQLAATAVRLQPWPPPLSVSSAVENTRTELARARMLARAPERPYEPIEGLLGDAWSAARAGSGAQASAMAVEAYAMFAAGPGRRLKASQQAIGQTVTEDFWGARGVVPALASAARRGMARSAIERAEGDIASAATVLGDHSASHATVVADAAVIVFREGLEAVLILAAITASFVGERRRLRRPVLIGAGLGVCATTLTYVLAQALLSALGDGGLRLQAITGLLAIAVLLVVTNWFFHRVYWSEWIGRFHRRRRALEKVDRFGLLSGQFAAFTILGLTSVYREGFETVLFLQNLQVSAGSAATVLGTGIGFAATLAVGFVTFKLERKLPYKKMLIATGILIGLVLAVMVGTTVHTMQGLGWIPDSATGFGLQLWCGRWLGLFPTWEGIGAQIAALIVTYGSYAFARALQRRRVRHASRATVAEPA